ncbi:MAG: LysE family translocator [Anaerolineae bacterium]|nr:LysE family translocator [Anaerolineae bacterium]
MGVSVAAPVGPIGILTIRRTLAHGRLSGLATGLGVATADAIYASIAAFSLTLVASFLSNLADPIRLVGGIFLLYLGVKAFVAPPAERAATAGGNSVVAMYGSALALTLTNPPTIFIFLGIFTGTGLIPANAESDAARSLVVVLGVFLGSVTWWAFLSGMVSLLRERFTPRMMRWVNRLSGAILIAFALWALAGLFAR